MAAILVKNAPERLHDWLRDTARRNRRSMTQQALYCLEWCMAEMKDEEPEFVAPLQLAGDPITLDMIDAARKAGRITEEQAEACYQNASSPTPCRRATRPRRNGFARNLQRKSRIVATVVAATKKWK